MLSFSKQSDISTAAVCENINKTFSELEDEYEGLEFTTLYSQGDYIEIVVNGVRDYPKCCVNLRYGVE